MPDQPVDRAEDEAAGRRGASRRRAGRWALAALIALAAWGAWGWRPGWPARAVLRTPGDTWPLAFAPDGRTFATSSPAGVTTWDVATGDRRATWDALRGRAPVAGLFAPDGRTFAAAVDGHPNTIAIALVDAATGRVRHVLPTGHTGIYALAFADEGRTLRAVLGDVPHARTVASWDVASGAATASSPVTCPTAGAATAVSPDTRLLAVVPFGAGTFRVWDLDAGAELGPFVDATTTVPLAGGLGFAADGRTLAAGREDGSIELWDIPTARVVRRFPGHSPGFKASWIRIAPDGRSLASHGEYGQPPTTLAALRDVWNQALGRRPAPEVIVLDLESGRVRARATGAIHPILAPDGATVATREADFSVRLRPNPVGPR